jgi:arginyl-tRNA synthetase
MAALVHTGEGNGFHPHHDVFHGMVAKEEEKISSSKKDALLIDHLVEWVDEQLEAEPSRAPVRRGHPSADRVASQIALGFFLLHPANKRIDFEPAKLLADGDALGWDLARARACDESALVRAGGAQMQNRAAEPELDPEYRFAVVQAETYGRMLGRVARSLDVAPLARYASHLARWQNEAERTPHVSRVVRSTLDRTARGLGLEAPA